MKYIRKVLAKIRGTFVTDCPRCHNFFYGFQQYGVQLKFERQYRVVCHKCAEAHKKWDKAM